MHNALSVEERVIGALAGLAIGDSMGMPTSFYTPEQIRYEFGKVDSFHPPALAHQYHSGLRAGDVTDDTEQSLALIRSFHRHRRVDPYDIAQELLAWSRRVEGKYVSPLGPSTRRALEEIANGTPVQEAGRTGDTNGAAMRITPLGIVHGLRGSNIEELVSDVELACLPTHGTDIAISSAAAVAWAVAVCIQGATDTTQVIRAASEAAVLGRERGVKVVSPSVSRRLAWLIDSLSSNGSHESRAQEIYDFIGAGMASAETVPAALGLFYIAEGDPREAILLATNMGGDCDTTAAIAGAVAGAFAGQRAIPENWIATIEQVNNLDLSGVAAELIATAHAWHAAT
ncbi:MAG: ADP-ribosylglycohydrolase family protein [Chloroflexi bacterium]|nr:ADP-ribosylglycohydrolase family protein [Chloroflexota bacterium]